MTRQYLIASICGQLEATSNKKFELVYRVCANRHILVKKGWLLSIELKQSSIVFFMVKTVKLIFFISTIGK